MTMVEAISQIEKKGYSTSVICTLYEQYRECKKQLNSEWIKKQSEAYIEDVRNRFSELYEVISSYVKHLEMLDIIEVSGMHPLDEMRIEFWPEEDQKDFCESYDLEEE